MEAVTGVRQKGARSPQERQPDPGWSQQDDSTEGGISPVVTLVDVEGASPGAGAAPGSLPGPGQGRARPACRRNSGHCLHTMYGWLQGGAHEGHTHLSAEKQEAPALKCAGVAATPPAP